MGPSYGILWSTGSDDYPWEHGSRVGSKREDVIRVLGVGEQAGRAEQSLAWEGAEVQESCRFTAGHWVLGKDHADEVCSHCVADPAYCVLIVNAPGSTVILRIGICRFTFSFIFFFASETHSFPVFHFLNIRTL